jgi:wee1-like protein kinase
MSTSSSMSSSGSPNKQGRLSMSFCEEEDESVMDAEDVVVPPIPNRSVTHDFVSAVVPANTPKLKTRLLFRGTNDDDDGEIANGFSSIVARRVPRFPGIVSKENSTELNGGESSEASSCASSIASIPPMRRKRSSIERQDGTPVMQNHKCDTTVPLSFAISPKISPNSFRTMDGRFVQSKNPFSSPMLSDTPTLMSHLYVDSTTAAPPLPSSFSDEGSASPTADGKPGVRPNMLQPKMHGTPVSEATVGLQAFSIHPQQRAHYVCSPIPEQSSPSNRPSISSTSLRFFPTMEADDVPSAGSLHKVRRIHPSDDVFAASNHHFSQLARRRHFPPIIDTKYGPHMALDDEDGISPTDVLSFPAFTPLVPKTGPPPTPVKQQRPRTGHYAPKTPVLSGHRSLPRTPLVSSGAFRRSPPEYDDEEEEEGDAHMTMLRNTSRFHADFDIIGELGQGSFGSVYKVRVSMHPCGAGIRMTAVVFSLTAVSLQVLSRLDGCMYAIKAAKRQAKGVADRDRMLKEVYALAALSDQADPANFHIVRYHQAWMEQDRLYIQTELCSGTLCDAVHRDLLCTLPSRKYKLLREMLLALEFIHRHNMVHLDIKPENIFIKNDQYKLGDFGLVTKAASPAGQEDVEEGDSRYMSLELLTGEKGTDLTKSDIFSLGVTMYEICLGRALPMNGPEWQDIRAGILSPLPNADREMASIIQRMMDPQAAQRPAAQALLKHPQLLSDEEKALNAERTKVMQANMQLAAQQQRHGFLPPKRSLTRANTWSGSSWPHL